MATVTITSACNTSLSPKYLLYDGGRDASFSAYLSDDPTVLKFRELARDLPPPAIEPLYQISLGSKKFTENGELKIFDAEKYFNGGMDDKKLQKRDRALHSPQTTINKTKVGTPSSCSEVSWNSQVALLPNARKDHDHIIQKQESGKRFILGFGCSCSGKRSVLDIEDEKSSSQGRNIVDLTAPVNGNMLMMRKETNVGRIQARPIEYTRETTPLTFPARNLGVGNLTVMGQPQEADEKPRLSLEVFGSPFLGKNGMAPSEHRRLMMSSVDSGRRIEDILATSVGKKTDEGEDDDDAGSDSSSDLFEIGALSAPRSCLSRQESDGATVFMDPTSCYPPSEASFEWSVVTASAADFSTTGSEYGVDRKLGPAAKAKSNKNKVSMVKEAQRRKTGSFLGCRSSKALDVATSTTHKSPEKRKPDPPRRLRPDTAPPLTFYTGATRVEDYDSPRFASPSPSHSHPAPALYAVHML